MNLLVTSISSKTDYLVAGKGIGPSKEIKAKSQNVHVDVACLFRGRTPLKPFAFRVHTHGKDTLGVGGF